MGPASAFSETDVATLFLNPSVQGESSGGGAVENRRFSIVSISVCTWRDGGACAGVVRSKRLNSASRSANPTEGPVTAATTWSAGTNAGSLTVYVAIKWYIRFLWATAVVMCRFYLWFTVGGLRLPGCCVTP